MYFSVLSCVFISLLITYIKLIIEVNLQRDKRTFNSKPTCGRFLVEESEHDKKRLSN